MSFEESDFEEQMDHDGPGAVDDQQDLPVAAGPAAHVVVQPAVGQPVFGGPPVFVGPQGAPLFGGGASNGIGP